MDVLVQEDLPAPRVLPVIMENQVLPDPKDLISRVKFLLSFWRNEILDVKFEC